jgi:hypothetical protein
LKQLEIFLKKYSYYPGETIEGVVILRLSQPLKVRKLTLRLVGSEKVKIDSEGSIGDKYDWGSYVSTFPIITKTEYLTPKIEIPEGEHHRKFSFKLPSDAFPSYRGSHAKVTYLLKAHADVPLWFDVKTQRTFWVMYDPSYIQLLSKPISSSTGDFYPLNSKPKRRKGLFGEKEPKPSFRVDLDKNTFLAGETITGTILIRNPTDKTIRKVKVKLWAREYASAQGETKYSTSREFNHKLEMHELVLDVPSKFAIPIPRNVVTSYTGRCSNCVWYLDFQLDIAFARDVKKSIPIAIYQWKNK